MAPRSIPAVKAHAVDPGSAEHSTQGYCYRAGRKRRAWESHLGDRKHLDKWMDGKEVQCD